MFAGLQNFFRQSTSLIGLDIGLTTIKLVQLDFYNQGYQVVCHAMVPLVSQDDAVITETLKQIWRDLKISCRQVAIAIPDDQVISKVIQLDASLTEHEIETCILLEADKYIAYPVKDINFDFQIHGCSAQNSNLLDVLLIAARKNVINAAVNAIQAANLVVKFVEIESQVIARLSHYLSCLKHQTVIALVYINKTTLTLMILKNNRCVFVRTELLIAAEFEQVKLVTTVQRLLQFYFSTHPQEDFHQLFLAGDKTQLLVTALTQVLDKELVVINPFASMQLEKAIAPSVLEQHAPDFLLSCGLALRGYTSGKSID